MQRTQLSKNRLREDLPMPRSFRRNMERNGYAALGRKRCAKECAKIKGGLITSLVNYKLLNANIKNRVLQRHIKYHIYKSIYPLNRV